MSIFSAFLFESFLTAFQFLGSKDINTVWGGEGSRELCDLVGLWGKRQQMCVCGAGGTATHRGKRICFPILSAF